MMQEAQLHGEGRGSKGDGEEERIIDINLGIKDTGRDLDNVGLVSYSSTHTCTQIGFEYFSKENKLGFCKILEYFSKILEYFSIHFHQLVSKVVFVRYSRIRS